MVVFSDDLEKTLHQALVIAGERRTEAGTVHLALALSENVFVGELLQACAVDPGPLRGRLRRMAGPNLDEAPLRAASPGEGIRSAVRRAVTTAQACGRRHLGSPQMLLALLDQPNDPISQALRDAGLTWFDAVRYISHGLRARRDTASAEVPSPPPPGGLFAVKLVNDDYTPMAFVVSVLRDAFDKDADDATSLMFAVHGTGTGECGVYPHEIAAAKVAAVAKLARDGQHPLHCVMEPREV